MSRVTIFCNSLKDSEPQNGKQVDYQISKPNDLISVVFQHFSKYRQIGALYQQSVNADVIYLHIVCSFLKSFDHNNVNRNHKKYPIKIDFHFYQLLLIYIYTA